MFEDYDWMVRSVSVPEAFRGKSVLLKVSLGDDDGFFSGIPLMEALRKVGAECYMIVSSEGSKVVKTLDACWEILDEQSDASKRFLSMVNDAFAKKGEKPFVGFIGKPDVVLQHRSGGFYGAGENVDMRGVDGWVEGVDKKPIEDACVRMLEGGFNMKSDEDFVQLIPTPLIKPRLPKKGYLSSYVEAAVLQSVAESIGNEVTSIFLNFKPDQNLPTDPHFESLIVFWALKHEKEVEGSIFKAYSDLSAEMGLSEFCVPPRVWFGFIGEGYLGKDVFGEVVGYPTPNGKTRWQHGFKLIRKHDWYSQSKEDGREPLLRFAITETMPVETFSRTINVDYSLLRERCAKIRDAIEGAEEIVVEGRKVNGARTRMSVEVAGRRVRVDDGIINMKPEANFGNFPAGEVYMTPEAVHGVFVADEVVIIDRSYLLKHPLIIELRGNEYEVVDGSEKILAVIRREREKAWKVIETWEAMGVPKDVVELNRKNFLNIGEFAVGLNPNARVSKYLIEVEKISRTVHVALGQGYDPDRPTTYHWDAVAGWNQELTVTAIKKGKGIPVLEDGKWKI